MSTQKNNKNLNLAIAALDAKRPEEAIDALNRILSEDNNPVEEDKSFITELELAKRAALRRAKIQASTGFISPVNTSTPFAADTERQKEADDIVENELKHAALRDAAARRRATIVAVRRAESRSVQAEVNPELNPETETIDLDNLPAHEESPEEILKSRKRRARRRALLKSRNRAIAAKEATAEIDGEDPIEALNADYDLHIKRLRETAETEETVVPTDLPAEIEVELIENELPIEPVITPTELPGSTWGMTVLPDPINGIIKPSEAIAMFSTPPKSK